MSSGQASIIYTCKIKTNFMSWHCILSIEQVQKWKRLATAAMKNLLLRGRNLKQNWRLGGRPSARQTEIDATIIAKSIIIDHIINTYLLILAQQRDHTKDRVFMFSLFPQCFFYFYTSVWWSLRSCQHFGEAEVGYFNHFSITSCHAQVLLVIHVGGNHTLCSWPNVAGSK